MTLNYKAKNYVMPREFFLAGKYFFCTFAPGEMAEWSIAAVLKTVEGNTSGGSNPSLSARRKNARQPWHFLFLHITTAKTQVV